MSTPLNLGIELDQDTDFNLTILISENGVPIDITGYQFKGQMRETTSASSPTVAEFQFSILNQTTNTGQVQWFLPVSDTNESAITTSIADSLEPKRLTTPFLFDVKMKDSNGLVSRIIQGIMHVSPEATQESF